MTEALPDPPAPTSAEQRILRAAQAEMLEAGLFGTSVDRVATRAGVSKQTLYALFPTRDDLFRDVLRMTLAEASAVGSPELGAADDPQTLPALVDWLDRSARAPANLELYRANIAAASAFPTLAADLHRLRTGSATVVALMRALQRQGALPAVAPERLANWLGVLSIGGPRQLLDLERSVEDEHANRRAIHRLFATGWRNRVEAEPLPHRATIEDSPLPERTPHAPGRVPEERWSGLLRHALERFAAGGVQRTSVAAVGASLGMGKMTIYRRYGSKEGLLAATIDQAVDDLLQQRGALAPGSEVAETLHRFALQIDRRAAHPTAIALMRLLTTLPAGSRQGARAAWLRLTRPDRAELAACLGGWVSDGRLTLEDPVLGAEHFLLLAGRGNVRLTDDLPWSEPEADRHAADLVRLCLHPAA